MCSGLVLNATMPSIEYEKSEKKLHFVSPATRSTFSYSSHSVLKPTHPKMPFEKRLYSLSEQIALTMRRVMRR